MTVIVVRGGIMAADTAVWQGNIISGHTKKIYRLSDGRLFGGTGALAVVKACVAWLEGGEKPSDEKEDDFGGLILAHDGASRMDHKFRTYRSEGEFQAIGAHVEFLIGALLMGASAAQAVNLAIQRGDSAGGDVQVEVWCGPGG